MNTTDKRMVIYVAGPYRGKTTNDVLHNIERARAVAEEIWRRGHIAICPHINTAFMGGVCPDEDFLSGDLEILDRCDAICMVNGWTSSEGATHELKAAEANPDINIYFEATGGVPLFQQPTGDGTD